MKITLFGNPGTGTTTVGKALAQKLGYEFKSSGNMFRNMAKELGISVEELDTRAQSDPQYDLRLDKMVAEYGQQHDDFIFESRLAWHFIPDSVKIGLVCDEHEAARRVAEREHLSIEDARKNNDLRLATYSKRYPVYYPEIHYPPVAADFDLVVNATSITADMVVEKIQSYLRQRDHMLASSK